MIIRKPRLITLLNPTYTKHHSHSVKHYFATTSKLPNIATVFEPTVHSSPSFTEPQAAPDQEESDSTNTSSESHPTDEPSPEQEGQEEPALEAQFEHALDVQEEELEYQDPVQEEPPQPLQLAAPPQPLAQLPAPQQVALPFPQPAPPVMAQPPMVTTKLRGELPDVFTGNRAESEAFKQEFQVLRQMNPNNEIMRTPYYR